MVNVQSATFFVIPTVLFTTYQTKLISGIDK
jgi:hypothetical protein